VALRGKAMDPAAGSWTLDAVFEGSSFKFGYLVSWSAQPCAAAFQPQFAQGCSVPHASLSVSAQFAGGGVAASSDVCVS
jgi:hypothetical protein